MKENEVIEKVTGAAGIGATAGIGLAALFGGPILIAALVGGGIACIGGAIMVGNKK